jgi:hypothetical protein
MLVTPLAWRHCVAEAFGWPATLEAKAAQALRPLAGDLTFVLFA